MNAFLPLRNEKTARCSIFEIEETIPAVLFWQVRSSAPEGCHHHQCHHHNQYDI
jgi:hypothetical protein